MPPGGGVGPHFDSYDVFLLQGEGRRRWQISSQRDLALVPDAPLKILSRFRASREWTLAAGDMLYLPPRCAHDGVALDECITYSIGFRAPSAQDLCGRFLEFLQDRLDAPQLYTDPRLKPTRHPAEINSQLTQGLLRLLDNARWSRDDLLQFIGEDLSAWRKPGLRLAVTHQLVHAHERDPGLGHGATYQNAVADLEARGVVDFETPRAGRDVTVNDRHRRASHVVARSHHVQQREGRSRHVDNRTVRARAAASQNHAAGIEDQRG